MHEQLNEQNNLQQTRSYTPVLPAHIFL